MIWVNIDIVSLCYSWQTDYKLHPTLEKLLQDKSKKNNSSLFSDAKIILSVHSV